MSKVALLFPMATMVFYVGVLGALNFWTRIGAYRKGDVEGRYFLTFTEGQPPPRVVVVGRHYDHQFQLPAYFLITASTAIALDYVSDWLVICAWCFIGARVLHSSIHLGANHPMKRAGAFAVGWLVLGLMWFDLVRAFV